MDDPRWLRLITIGLILAALAVGYFLFTGKFSSNSAKTAQSAPEATTVLGQTVKTQNGANSSPNPSVNPSSTPVSAYTRIVSRNQNQVQTLPATGFPAGLAIAFSISAMFVGYGLRRFPR